MKEYDIKFKGIDDWNRPVYEVVGLKAYIGDVENLFDWDATKEQVDKFFMYGTNIKNLVIFGSRFNEGDPLGAPIKDDIKLNII